MNVSAFAGKADMPDHATMFAKDRFLRLVRSAGSMHFVLRPDPAHDRTLAPSIYDSGESPNRTWCDDSQFVWSGELGEQARYCQIRPTEAGADKVSAAVCKLLA